MRKSNWSDLLSALAMSARDNVRRLFESATINARAVISAIKTFLTLTISIPGDDGRNDKGGRDLRGRTFASLAEENRRYNMKKDIRNVEAVRCGQTICSNHLGRTTEVMSRLDGSKLERVAPSHQGHSS